MDYKLRDKMREDGFTSYPKVDSLLRHYVLSTNVRITDNSYGEYLYYEGRVYEYFESEAYDKNLYAIRCVIKDDILLIEVEENYYD